MNLQNKIQEIFELTDEELIEKSSDFDSALVVAGTQTQFIDTDKDINTPRSELVIKCWSDHITYCQAIGNIREELLDAVLLHKH